MQVILDSSFARPGSAPIWGGKKGEFRDRTNMSTDCIRQECEREGFFFNCKKLLIFQYHSRYTYTIFISPVSPNHSLTKLCPRLLHCLSISYFTLSGILRFLGVSGKSYHSDFEGLHQEKQSGARELTQLDAINSRLGEFQSVSLTQVCFQMDGNR